MLAATEGIVLHWIKYGESSVIATLFTREFGRQSFMLNASRSRKSANKAGLLQPLFLLDLEVYEKQSRDMQRIKSLKSLQAYQNIPFDIAKSTQVIFLAEVLYKTIHEQESYTELFDFMKSALLYFDLMENGWQNFHLYFLFRLTEYFGFMPNTEKNTFESWFDLKKGAVVANEPSHPFFANKELTEKLIRLSQLKINELDQFRIRRSEREVLLSILIDYYQLHFENLGELKSMKVLREVFQ